MHWLGLVVALAGVILAGMALFRAFWPIAPGPEYRELSASARGQLELRIRHNPGEPDRAAPVDDLPLLRTAARIMLIQRNLLALWLGCFLISFGTTLASLTLVHLIVTGLVVVPLIWLSLYIGRRSEAGAAFLRRYPVPPNPGDVPVSTPPEA